MTGTGQIDGSPSALEDGINVSVEKSDNGLIVRGTICVAGKVTNRSLGITAKDTDSDQTKRRIQRAIVKWVKAAFPAPKRAVKAKAAAAATA